MGTVSWLQNWTFMEAWPGQESGLRKADGSTATTCPRQLPGGAQGSASLALHSTSPPRSSLASAHREGRTPVGKMSAFRGLH